METSTTTSVQSNQDEEYQQLLEKIQNSFDLHAGEPLFIANVENLFDVYLSAFPEEHRQHYNCHACRRFLNHFGSMVTIGASGEVWPLMWDFSIRGFFEPVVDAMRKAIRRAKIVDTVPLHQQLTLGIPETGEWHHFAVDSKKFVGGASRLQDYITVKRAIGEFDADVIDRALVLLNSDALYRSEKVIGPAVWFRSLYGMNDKQIWRAVATAPEGFCHPRSSMIGTLLEDLQAGVSVDDASRKFAAKMHPLQYQRPTSAPSDQTIKQAEEIVAKLKAAGSFKRRFLRPDEVKSIWTPKEQAKPADEGVFGSLKKSKKAEAVAAGSAINITWDKFRKTVLPTAEKIFCHLTSYARYPLAALVTAVDPESQPILQWDQADNRNPVSWYVYNGGSYLTDFGLAMGVRPVYAITLQPNQWTDEEKFQHNGAGACLLIEGCKDHGNRCLGLFPEAMRSEFHGIRKVIEAYSANNALMEIDGPAAAGIMIQKSGGGAGQLVEVETLGQRVLYKIDRWD